MCCAKSNSTRNVSSFNFEFFDASLINLWINLFFHCVVPVDFISLSIFYGIFYRFLWFSWYFHDGSIGQLYLLLRVFYIIIFTSSLWWWQRKSCALVVKFVHLFNLHLVEFKRYTCTFECEVNCILAIVFDSYLYLFFSESEIWLKTILLLARWWTTYTVW